MLVSFARSRYGFEPQQELLLLCSSKECLRSWRVDVSSGGRSIQLLAPILVRIFDKVLESSETIEFDGSEAVRDAWMRSRVHRVFADQSTLISRFADPEISCTRRRMIRKPH